MKRTILASLVLVFVWTNVRVLSDRVLPADPESGVNLLKEKQDSYPPADIPLQKQSSASLFPKLKTNSNTVSPRKSTEILAVSLHSPTLIKSPKLERKLNTGTNTSDIEDDIHVQKPPESNMVVKPTTKGAVNLHGNTIPGQNKIYDTGNGENSTNTENTGNDYEEDRQSTNENENTQYNEDTFERHKELSSKENPEPEDRIHKEQNILGLSKESPEEEKVGDMEHSINTENTDNDYEEDGQSANENDNTRNDKDTVERPKELNSKQNQETEDRIHTEQNILSKEPDEEEKVAGDIKRERDSENKLNISLVSSTTTNLFSTVTKSSATLRTNSANTVKTTKSSVKVQTAQATNGSSHYSSTKITVTTTSTPTDTAKHPLATTQPTTILTTFTTGKQKNALHFSKSESMIQDNVEKKTGDKTKASSDCPFNSDSDLKYGQSAVIAAAVGGIFVGSALVFFLFYARGRCKKYINGDYRRVPIEYDFELNPRFKTH